VLLQTFLQNKKIMIDSDLKNKTLIHCLKLMLFGLSAEQASFLLGMQGMKWLGDHLCAAAVDLGFP
jgi:hypothetical protein